MLDLRASYDNLHMFESRTWASIAIKKRGGGHEGRGERSKPIQLRGLGGYVSLPQENF